MTDFFQSHPWLSNLLVGTLAGISAITLNQVLAVITIVLGIVNLFFTLRDKWWRDPVRKAKRAAKRRQRKLKP
jgi:hypothetical protein